MKIRPDYVLPYVMPIAMLFVISSIVGFDTVKAEFWTKTVDIFTEGLPFESALEALKQGKSIRRKRSDYGLTRMVVSIRGIEEEKFCQFYLQDRSRVVERPILMMEDVLATDWLIEE